MILVDTSAWIHFFHGAGPVADRVDQAIDEDEAAWCGPVATELRRGFVNAKARAKALELLGACHWLPQPEAIWEEAGDLGFALARKGVTVKTLDLLIATHALAHGAEVLTTDGDFQNMKAAGIPLFLVELDPR